MQYEKEKNVRLLSDPMPIKFLPDGIKVLCSLIASSVKEGNCSNSWEFLENHCATGSSQIQCINFDQSYSPVAYYYPLRINVSIMDMHRLTSRVLDVSHSFQN